MRTQQTSLDCYDKGVKLTEIQKALDQAMKTAKGQKMIRSAAAKIRGDKGGRPKKMKTCPKCGNTVMASALTRFRVCPHDGTAPKK